MLALRNYFLLGPSPKSDLHKQLLSDTQILQFFMRIRSNRKILLLSESIVILATKDLFFNEVSKIYIISLYLLKAKKFWRLYAYYISNYTFLVLSNLWDLIFLKYDVINQNSLKTKHAAYRYHHNILLTKDLRLII